MDRSEVTRLMQVYAQMPDDEILDILLSDEQTYGQNPYEAYEILREEAKRRGLLAQFETLKEQRREEQQAHEAPQEFVVILSGTMMEVGMAKGLLEENGIPAFLQNETLGTLAGPYASAAGLGSVQLVVEKRDLPKARAILNEYLEGK